VWMRLQKPIEDTPRAPARQPARRRLKKPIEETPQPPTPKRTRIATQTTVPYILPPSGSPQGGACGTATPKAKAKPRAKAQKR
ncbi:MAG: hypothetical protein ACKPKO_54435, partial [Candidatus Fonsibacter sp.]